MTFPSHHFSSVKIFTFLLYPSAPSRCLSSSISADLPSLVERFGGETCVPSCSLSRAVSSDPIEFKRSETADARVGTAREGVASFGFGRDASATTFS